MKENDVFFLENRARVARVARVARGSCQILSVGEYVEVRGTIKHNRSGYVDLTADHLRKTHCRPLENPNGIDTAADVIS